MRFTKFDNEWVLKVEANEARPRVGDIVDVSKRDGTATRVRITVHCELTTDDGGCLLSFAPVDTEPRRAARKPTRATARVTAEFIHARLAAMSAHDRHDLFDGAYGIGMMSVPTLAQLRALGPAVLRRIDAEMRAA